MTDEVTRILTFDEGNAERRRAALDTQDKLRFSPLEAQVAFLKELVKNPEEGKKFTNDPKQYAIDHG